MTGDRYYPDNILSPFPVTAPAYVPDPLQPVVTHARNAYGLTVQETMALDAGTPIFQQLIHEAVMRQVKHEEDQLRAWLAAIIDNPAGRKIIEEML